MARPQTQTPGEFTPKPDAFAAVGSVQGDDDEVAALRAQLAAQANQIAGLSAAVTQMARNSIPAKQSTDDDLPDQSEFVISELTRPVLTKQGWLVPAELPHTAAALR